MTVRDIMTRAVESASPEETVLDARDRFRSGGFRHLPVVDRGRLVGMISDRDVLRAAGPSLGPTEFDDDVGPGVDRTLRELMSPYPVTADPTMSIEEAADTMLREDVSSLPVLDEGHLVGIVTTADILRLADALREVKERVRFCSICGNVSEEEQCRICRDPRRDLTVLCVVEESKDVVAIERTREFRGRYHVLGGAINPIEGVGPDDLRIRELMARLADNAVTEVILATDPNLEGEATATYLARMISPLGIAVSRLASGLPVGGDLEYADEVTLGRAFEGRRRV